MRSLAALFIINLLLLTGCGKQTQAPKENVPQTREMVPIVFSLDAPVGDYKIDISGCSSGFSATDVSADSVLLYRNDENCTATLKELRFNNLWWSGTSVCCQPAEKVIFTSAGAPNEFLSVARIANVASPVLVGGVIKFSFGHIKPGNSSTGFVGIKGPGYDTVANKIPNFSFTTGSDAMLLINASEDTGYLGFFRFNLECDAALDDTNVYCLSIDQQQLLTDFRVALVTDVWVSDPTAAELAAAMGGSPATVTTVNKNIPTFKGGFTADLWGEGDMRTAANRKMILIIEYRNANPVDYSYAFFHVFFATSAN